MPIQYRTLYADLIFNIEHIYEPIFCSLCPAALLRVSRTCRSAYAAVSAYTRLAFSIDRLLSRFFPSPTPGPGCSVSCCFAHTHTRPDAALARARAFRTLQARTGTLVSGSAALQFFARTEWAESDLDLYVHIRARREVGRWLIGEGYRYRPMDFQDPEFEVEIAECVTRRPNGIYSMPGVMAILTFVKPLPAPAGGNPVGNGSGGESESGSESGESEGDGPRELKVQIIVAKNTPMEVILGFHSTCVMNVISYEKAYCLCPQATLEERRTLLSASCRGKGKHRLDGLLKYEKRGWQVLYFLPPDEIVPDPVSNFSLARPCSPARRSKPAFRMGWRWIDDGASWVLPLPQTGVTPPPQANASTCALMHDPAAVCNWEVRLAPGRRDGAGVTMHFEVAESKVLRFRYLVADETLVAFLVRALGTRVRFEEAKADLQLEEWTYYDAELPALCREFLHDLAARRLSALRL